MEVILLKDLSFGDKGAVVKVSNGHARNLLIPNGLAIEATKNNLKHIDRINAQRKKKIEKEKAEIQALAEKIKAHAGIELKAKAGENGVMFGSITHTQITDAINSAFNLALDKKRILVKNIREGGVFNVPLKLSYGITASAKINVVLEIEKKEDAVKAAKKPRGRKKKEETAETSEATEQTEETAEEK